MFGGAEQGVVAAGFAAHFGEGLGEPLVGLQQMFFRQRDRFVISLGPHQQIDQHVGDHRLVGFVRFLVEFLLKIRQRLIAAVVRQEP